MAALNKSKKILYSMQNIVISIGGSVILSHEANALFLQKLADLVTKLSKQYKIFIIIGGGKVARDYIQRGRELKFDEKTLDAVGIDITRINAKMFALLVKGANKLIPCTTDEAKALSNPIVVMGGTIPGHSTDTVGAELAEKTNALRFVNATNVDGIYDKDPNKYPNAKQLKEISVDDLIVRYGTSWESAGKNVVIDGPALTIIKRARLSTYVVNGKRLDQLEKAITGQPFHGTKIFV